MSAEIRGVACLFGGGGKGACMSSKENSELKFRRISQKTDNEI